MSVQEIESAISQLPADKLAELMAWLADHHERVWDQQIESDLEATIANDQQVRPPVDLAQTIEWVFDGTSKSLGQTSTEISYSFPMTLNAFNAGYVDAGDTWADVYLTNDPNNVTSGYYIGTHDFGYIGTYQFAVQNATLTIPTNVPPSTYYVGWVLSDANQQYYTDKNVAEAFGVMKEKNMYGKKVRGVARTTFVIGPEGKIQHIFENVKADGHAEQVLAYLKAAAKGAA